MVDLMKMLFIRGANTKLKMLSILSVLCCLGLGSYIYWNDDRNPFSKFPVLVLPMYYSETAKVHTVTNPQTSTTTTAKQTAKPTPQPDPCKKRIRRPSNSNMSINWWEWACLIESQVQKKHLYRCFNITDVGNWKICSDHLYKPRKPCIVYSFGINFDYSFDDAMAKLNCSVYSFDPSMRLKDHKHSSRVYFRNMGIASRDDDAFIPNMDMYVTDKTTWKVKTLKSIKKMLGHQNTVIDVLKIDIEVYEWDVVRNLLQDDMFKYVRQFLVEWHLFPDLPSKTEYGSLLRTLLELESIGIHSYFKGIHPKNHKLEHWNFQADMFYVNTQFRNPY